MKDFRYLGEESERLGARMDAARAARESTKSKWAKKYWHQVFNRLKLEWQRLPILHDADAKMTITPKWTVDYEFYESGNKNEGSGIADRIYDKFKLDANLDASWHANRERRLAKAQY
jgi:hypothetical protein